MAALEQGLAKAEQQQGQQPRQHHLFPIFGRPQGTQPPAAKKKKKAAPAIPGGSARPVPAKAAPVAAAQEGNDLIESSSDSDDLFQQPKARKPAARMPARGAATANRKRRVLSDSDSEGEVENNPAAAGAAGPSTRSVRMLKGDLAEARQALDRVTLAASQPACTASRATCLPHSPPPLPALVPDPHP